MIRGIDISHWNDIRDIMKVKKEGIKFAIIKAGGSDRGFYKDKKFDQYYNMCKEAGIKVGSYYFVGKNCISYDAGVADAKRFIDIIKDLTFEMPVYIDLESTAPVNKKGATDACIGFCKTMEASGYYVGIYASDISGFKDRLDISKLSEFDKWVARYGTKPKYCKDWGMWQASSRGQIEGIRGFVDIDYTDIDYFKIIKNHHLNGF